MSSSRTASLVVEMVDRISGPASKVGKALKATESQTKAIAKAMAGTGVSDRMVKTLGTLGASAAHVDRVSESFRRLAHAERLAADRSQWTKQQIAAVKDWERQTITALRAVKREQAAMAKAHLTAAPLPRQGAVRERTNIIPTGAAMAGARYLGPAALAYGTGKAVKAFADVEARFVAIGLTADAVGNETNTMMRENARLAYDLGMAVGSVADGYDALAAQGRKVSEIREFMPAVAKTARAAGAEVRDIANSAGAIGSAMDIAGSRMEAAFDIMVKGGQEGKFELKDMARYLPSMAPLAAAIGMKGEEGLKRLVATAQVIRNQTGTPEEAASSLNNIFAKMESEETTKKFKKFGVDLRKEMERARKEGKDLLSVFVDLSDKALKGDLSKVPQLFTDMEFARGMRALLSQRDELKRLIGTLGEAAGTVNKNLSAVLGSTEAKITRMTTAWQNFSTALGSNIAGPASRGLESLAAALDDVQKRIEIYEAYRKGKGEEGPSPLNPGKRGERAWWDAPARIGDWVEDQFDKSYGKTPESAEEAGRREKREAYRAAIVRDQKAAAALLEKYQSLPAFGSHTNRSGIRESLVPIEDRLELARRREQADAVKQRADEEAFQRRMPEPKHGESYYGPPRMVVAPQPPARPAESGPVKAELTGSAEVKGQATLDVKVTVGSEFIRVIDGQNKKIMALEGKIDAAAASRNTGVVRQTLDGAHSR